MRPAFRFRLATGLLSLCLFAGLATSAQAEQRVEVRGVEFDTRLDDNGIRYALLGSGVFRYLVWNAYAGAYYQEASASAPAPLSDVPKRLELEYFHAIDAEDFADATRESLQERLDAEAFSQLATAIDDFNRTYRDVTPGDRYVLSWDGSELRLALNGEPLYRGDDLALANALFGIWLGSDPLRRDFRDALLGR
ncbi:chalcone isomerase family protein [Franzmannia qiaohouensis]|uniref:Chalcone isomerase family protein n=1 Tax=Franzmannia qiaohouensis TaxID=1329370 RepID=A0ABU1H8F0_9GAMM|nr:chalcone isomerase family protein [Halomonas qiaohouensis]MDR5903733.1 chalcone isomerase family protein [Halomonas qiaohouensis]